MKADCDGNCTHCNETELPNIKDKDCDSIGYSYAYKTDCAGDRYIKVDEVRYLLKCERNKAIYDFTYGVKQILEDNSIYNMDCIYTLAEQLKAGEQNEQSI